MRTRFSPHKLLWMGLAATLLLWPSEALAQRGRGGHGGGGRTSGSGGAVHRGPVHSSRPVYTRPYYRPYYYRSYYRPYYYSPYFYSSFYWGWGGFGYYPYYPYWGYPVGGYYRSWYDDLGALRVEVKPRDAQVYVDGYFAGLVDDFDGISQRLRARPGEHQIDVYMPGFQTFSEKMLFRPGQTLKIKTTLQPLAAGEAQPPKPEPLAPPPAPPDASASDDPGPPPPSSRRAPYRPAPPAVDVEPAPAAPPEQGSSSRSNYGTLSIRVQPRDAVVLIDGEKWEGDPRERLVIEVSEGTHRIEVQKAGFTTYSTDVRVRRGQVTTVNVSLTGAREIE